MSAERAERHVEKHRHYAVDVAFRYRLDRRAHDAALGKPVRVAPDDAPDLAARAFDVSFGEQPRDGSGFVLERLEGYRRVEQIDVDRRVCPLAYEGRERQDKRHSRADRDEHRGAEHSAARLRAAAPVEKFLVKAYQPPDARDGVRNTARVPENRVEQ